MEELSSVGEQVFAAECILSKRLRKVRAPPSAPRMRLALCAAHRPLLSPRRASWSTWSSGAAGPPSKSPVRGRFPARASRPGWELSHHRLGREVLCLGIKRTPADRCCPLFTSPRGASRAASARSPSGPARLRVACFWRPFVACAPALELAAAGAGRGPPPLAQVILL